MKLHKKTEEKQKPTLARQTQFIYKGFQASLYRSANQLTQNTFRAWSHTKTLQVKQLSHIVRNF